MILLGNQLALQFNIGGIDDFIDIEDFHYMRIAENAGGVRPIIDVSFEVHDSRIIDYLNSGNIITLMYGVHEPVSEIAQFEIWGDGKNKEMLVGSTVNLAGAMYNRGFTSQKKSDIFTNKKSFEALKQIAEQDGLNFVTNTNIKTNDTQNWYQSGITDWRMSNYIAERAYKDNNTFFVYGFDNTNYYFYDVAELLKSGIKWYFSCTHTTNDINAPFINIGSYKCDNSASGMNAELIGKNTVHEGYNVDTGEFTKPRCNLKTFTTMDTDKININSTDCINYEYNITSLDEHTFSIEAQKQNYKNNLMYSSYVCHVPICGTYHEFNLFDVVQLMPGDYDKEAEGIYFITGISKEYKDYQYKTILTLNRESPNCIKGDLEEGA